MSRRSRNASTETVTEWPLVTRIKLRQLALIVALTQRRTLRQAASDVAITQPAATKLLHELEAALGVPLFTRHAWGTAPTIYGEALVRHASSVLNELSEAREELTGIAAGETGFLRIGGVTGAMPGLLAPAIRRLRQEQPAVKLFVLINSSQVQLAALRQGELDVAICSLPADADLNGLEVAPLGDEPLRMVARVGHPLARRRSLTLRALAGATWLIQPPNSPLRRDVEAIMSEAGLRLPAATIETVSIVATLALLQDSDAITVMPRSLARHYARFGMVAELALELASHTSRYEVVTRARRELSPAARAFVTMLPGAART